MNSDLEFKEYFLSLIDYHYYKIICNYRKIYFFFEKKYLMDYDLDNNQFNLSYAYIFSKLESKFGYTHNQVKIFIKLILEEHYELKDLIIEGRGSYNIDLEYN